MRYLYTILAIIVLASAGIGLLFFSRSAPPPDIAIRINDRVITRDELNRLWASASSPGLSKDEFIHSLINRELLLIEAQAQGVDQEESFRRSIKNYYEQSLTKILMDRKYTALMPKVEVSDAEIDSYTGLYGKRLRLTRFRLTEAQKTPSDLTNLPGEALSLPFADLSWDMQVMLMPLKEGEVSGPVREGTSYAVYRIDKIEESIPAAPLTQSREETMNQLHSAKAGREMDAWLADLARKASIEIHVEGLENTKRD